MFDRDVCAAGSLSTRRHPIPEIISAKVNGLLNHFVGPSQTLIDLGKLCGDVGSNRQKLNLVNPPFQNCKSDILSKLE